MKRNFIVDQEINLEDGSDYLNTRIYAKTLEEIIRRAPSGKPFTVGLFGEWGSGKSSIIKTAKERLAGAANFNVKFAVFDAWKYSEDAFRRSFILSLAASLCVKQEFNLYTNQTEHISKLKISLKTWLIWGGILAALLAAYLFVPWIKNHVLTYVLLLCLYVASLGGVVLKELIPKMLTYLPSLVMNKYDEERPLLFSPEQFAAEFNDIVDKGASGLDRLVIVIDNIDRCEKHYATELLTTVKGFLETRDRVLFLLPVDEAALKRHLKKTDHADDREADEYLRKFFNVTLKIKLYHPTEIYEFAKQLNNKHKLGFSDYTIDLVSEEYASNPRRIIQMFNNLSAELECFTEETFVKENETAICKLLILREEFPLFYAALSKNSDLLNIGSEGLEKLLPEAWSEELANFLNRTSVITGGISPTDLNGILSNSVIFSTLPPEIEDMVTNMRYDDLEKFIDEKTEFKELILEYLLDKLDRNYRRNLYGNSFINVLSLLIKINAAKQISLTFHKRIEFYVKSGMGHLLRQINDMGELIAYSWSLKKLKRTYLVDAIISRINDEMIVNTPDDKWIRVLKQVIDMYQDKQDLEKLTASFKRSYSLEWSAIPVEEFNELQGSVLAKDELAQSIIPRMTSLEQSDVFCRDLKFVLKWAKSVQTGEELLKRINSIYPDFNGLISISRFTVRLQHINTLMDSLQADMSRSAAELQVLADKVWKSTLSPLKLSYVDEIIAGQDDPDALIRFTFNVYRLGRNKADVVLLLKKLLAVNRLQAKLNAGFNELLHQGISIAPFATLILGERIYRPESLALIKEALTVQEKGNYVIPDEDAKNKLKELLHPLYVGDKRSGVLLPFLEEVILDERAKGLVMELISLQREEYIENLSPALQALRRANN